MTNILQIGSRVHSILYGGRDGVIYAIHGEQQPETCRSIGGVMVTGGRAEFDVVWDNGTESHRLPECLVKGSVQWEILDGIADAAEIQALRGLAILETNRRADEKAAKDREYSERVTMLRNDKNFGHLKQTGPDVYGSAKLAASNIRAELKKAFPGVKFSVRSETFSGGDSIDVKWMDGPTIAEVQKITGKYSAGSFNGMEDIYEYSRSAWTAVFGDAKYIHCQHEHSFDALREAVREVCLEYGWELLKVEQASYGAYLPCDNHDKYRVVYDFIEKRGQYSKAA